MPRPLFHSIDKWKIIRKREIIDRNKERKERVPQLKRWHNCHALFPIFFPLYSSYSILTGIMTRHIRPAKYTHFKVIAKVLMEGCNIYPLLRTPFSSAGWTNIPINEAHIKKLNPCLSYNHLFLDLICWPSNLTVKWLYPLLEIALGFIICCLIFFPILMRAVFKRFLRIVFPEPLGPTITTPIL